MKLNAHQINRWPKVLTSVVLAFFSILVLSCVSVEKLSEEERKVRVTSDPNSVTGCRFIKQVTQDGNHFFGKIDWEGGLKKASVRVGGDVVLFDQMVAPGAPYFKIVFRGEIYNCKNKK